MFTGGSIQLINLTLFVLGDTHRLEVVLEERINIIIKFFLREPKK